MFCFGVLDQNWLYSLVHSKEFNWSFSLVHGKCLLSTSAPSLLCFIPLFFPFFPPSSIPFPPLLGNYSHAVNVGSSNSHSTWLMVFSCAFMKFLFINIGMVWMASCPVSYYFIQLYSFDMPTLLPFPCCSLALIPHSIPVMHVHIPHFTHTFTYFSTPRVPFSLCICEGHFWSRHPRVEL